MQKKIKVCKTCNQEIRFIKCKDCKTTRPSPMAISDGWVVSAFGTDWQCPKCRKKDDSSHGITNSKISIK